MTPEWLALWSSAFADTIVVETPLYLVFLVAALGPWRAALASLALQMATHPVLWLAWPLVSPHIDYAPLVVIAETLVVTAEACLLRFALGPGRWALAVVAALVANATSTVVGLVQGDDAWLALVVFALGLLVADLIRRRMTPPLARRDQLVLVGAALATTVYLALVG